MISWNCDDLYGNVNARKPTCHGTVVFVDPGLEGTGVARWFDFTSPANGTGAIPPDDVCSILPRHTMQWADRMTYVWREWEDWLGVHHIDRVAVESQGVWMESATSTASAASGVLLKLVLLTGGLLEGCRRHGIRWSLVAPAQWKGQLPKDAMHRRIIKQLGHRYPEHVADAVGMGLAAQGRL